MKRFFTTTFSSLQVRNYRLYYIAQTISMSGMFLQILAQDWLVLKLTDSGVMLGLVSAVQFLPMLLLVSWGGVIADRFSKLRLLYITQISSGVLALVLGILVLVGAIQVWMVFVFALCLGLTNSINNPTQQSFVFEMVGREHIKNAVSLWAILISASRIIGPTLAGILIATVGLGECFIINAVSYVAVVGAFFMMRPSELYASALVPQAKGQIREGLRYVASNPILFRALMMMAIIGTVTYEWQASLPLFARFVLNGDAGTYAAITVALSTGMLAAGLVNAQTKGTSQLRLVYSAFFLGIFTILAGFAQNELWAVIAFVFVGIFFMSFTNLDISTLQLTTDPTMRGRVMSLWSMAFHGSTAVGGPLIGWIGQSFGAQWSLIVGGAAALIAALYGFISLRKNPQIHS